MINPMDSKTSQPMSETAGDKQNASVASPPKRKHRLRRILIALIIVLGILVGGVYIYENISFWSDRTFARRLDESIARAHAWTEQHKDDILKRKNIALIRMLQDCDTLHQDPLCTEIVNHFLHTEIQPDCWKRLLDKDHFVRSYELNQLIDKEGIDNKWILYAIAKEKTELDQDIIDGLFDPNRWRSRQLTHQLWALIHLRLRQGSDKKTEQTVSKICNRLERHMKWSLPVNDIYTQKIDFMLFAGNVHQVNRRWIERVIANQRSDGGWNDRWYRFFESRRRPVFDFQDPPSNQHASLQALWLLYQVKYRYPQHFGLDVPKQEKQLEP